MKNFRVIIVEDVPLELKGTEGIFKNDIPEAEIIGTAENEMVYWRLMKQQKPDLVLLDLGLGGSTTIGVEICRQTKDKFSLGLIMAARQALPIRVVSACLYTYDKSASLL